MRTTVRIDDDVLRQLKSLAGARDESLASVLNRCLRLGLQQFNQPAAPREPYREVVVSMGQPRVDLTSALSLAAQLEDEETVEKLQRRK